MPRDLSIHIMYLTSLFVYQICWCALCWLEKFKPSEMCVLGANIGFLALVFAIVIAFFTIKWWTVLIFYPVIWLLGGFIGGKIACRWNYPVIYFLVCVSTLSVMYHTFRL